MRIKINDSHTNACWELNISITVLLQERYGVFSPERATSVKVHRNKIQMGQAHLRFPGGIPKCSSAIHILSNS